MTQQKWGYEHPAINSENALMLFTRDLSRTIEDSLQKHTLDDLDLFLFKTQQSINALIKTYQEIPIHPNYFHNQSIELSFEFPNERIIPLLAMKTSPELEARILAMQQRVSHEEM